MNNILTMQIFINPANNQELICKISQQQQALSQTNINLSQWPGDEFFYFWLLHACKVIFYEQLPLTKIDCIVQDHIPKLYPTITNILSKLLNTIDNTSNFIVKHQYLIPTIKTHQKILMYNADNNPFFYDLYEDMLKTHPDNIIYENMQTGWDVHLRKVNNIPVLSAEAMLQKLMDHQISRIIHINTYYLDSLLAKQNIHFFAICVALGFEWVSLHNDTNEYTNGGYLLKSALHHPKMTMFCSYPSYVKHWDKIFHLENISYVPLYRKKILDKHKCELSNDYELLLYSNSRLDYIAANLTTIFHYYSLLDQNNIFQDYQQLYLAARYLMLNNTELDQTKKLLLDTALVSKFFAFYNFSKFLVIEHLVKHSERKVLLFGDNKWEKLFPEVYQNKYLNDQEINALFATKKYLQIIPCTNYSYFESNPVYPKAIQTGIPFLGYPQVISLPETAGFKAIEFTNLEELLSKANDYKPWRETPQLQNSIDYFMQTTNQCLEEYIAKALAIEQKEPLSGTFAKVAQHSETQFNLTMQPYIDRNTTRIIALINSCLTAIPKIDLPTHPLGKHDFVHKIIKLYPPPQ